MTWCSTCDRAVKALARRNARVEERTEPTRGGPGFVLLAQRGAVEPCAVALERGGVPLNPRIAVLKLGTYGFSHLGPAQRRHVMAHGGGKVRLAGLLVPSSALRSF